MGMRVLRTHEQTLVLMCVLILVEILVLSEEMLDYPVLADEFLLCRASSASASHPSVAKQVL